MNSVVPADVHWQHGKRGSRRRGDAMMHYLEASLRVLLVGLVLGAGLPAPSRSASGPTRPVAAVFALESGPQGGRLLLIAFVAAIWWRSGSPGPRSTITSGSTSSRSFARSEGVMTTRSTPTPELLPVRSGLAAQRLSRRHPAQTLLPLRHCSYANRGRGRAGGVRTPGMAIRTTR